MEVRQSGYTIDQYCSLMDSGGIVVNPTYQRSSVWPPAARSYLIDTILLGYPIPKICLHQKTDLRSRRTTLDIVDGQQRSRAIYDFFKGKLRISTNSELFAGRKYEQLDDEYKLRFLSYPIYSDVFVVATDDNIRQLFRRMNSYTVPLNPEEQRHAINQGEFKWFISGLSEKYSTALKKMGVFGEARLSRMQDDKLFTELCLVFREGVETFSKSRLDRIYKDFDSSFPEKERYSSLIDTGMAKLLEWEPIHNTSLMKPFLVYSLLLAIVHLSEPQEKLQALYPLTTGGAFGGLDTVLSKLSNAEGYLNIDQEAVPEEFRELVDASATATNTKTNREKRFVAFCRILGG